jgi:hypothetical protein
LHNAPAAFKPQQCYKEEHPTQDKSISMPQIAATSDTVRDLATQHLERNVANRVIAPNKTYEGEWKRYKDWVLRGRANNIIPPGAKFIAIPNVELYLNQVVVTRAITAPSARQIWSALQYYGGQTTLNMSFPR